MYQSICGMVSSVRMAGSSWPKFFAHDELQPGPHVIDGTDLDVDEAERQSHLSNDVLRDVGRHVRGLLRPRHPDRGARAESFSVGSEGARKLGLLRAEHVVDVLGLLDLRREPNGRR